ncbi:hypothetical protein ACHAP5_010404 [Fusarium lateritium]
MSHHRVTKPSSSGARRPISELLHYETSGTAKRTKLEPMKRLENTIMARVNHQYETAMCLGDAAERRANYAIAFSERALESYELATKALKDAKQILTNMEKRNENAQASCHLARKIKKAREAIESRDECKARLTYFKERVGQAKIELATLEDKANLLVDKIQIDELESFFDDQIDRRC